MILTILAAIIGLLALLPLALIWPSLKLKKEDLYKYKDGFVVSQLVATGTTLLTISGLIILAASWTHVKAYEIGVPVTLGKVGDPIQPGISLTAPWTKVETFPTRPESVPDVTINARTSQSGSVKATAGARWSVNPTKAAELYLQVRTGDEEKISKEIVDKALGQAIGNTFAALDNTAAVSDRKTVEADLLTALKELAEPYGININQVFVRSVEPDAKTADSLARIAAQKSATSIATEAQKTARAEAERRKIEAEGLREAAAKLQGITDPQVRAICAQSWERQQQAATDAGHPMYTSPCGTGTSVVAK